MLWFWDLLWLHTAQPDGGSQVKPTQFPDSHNHLWLHSQLQVHILSFQLQIYNILFEQEKIQYAEEMDKFRREKQEAVTKEMHEQVSLLKQMQEQDRTLQHSAPQHDHHHMSENLQSNFPPTIHRPWESP